MEVEELSRTLELTLCPSQNKAAEQKLKQIEKFETYGTMLMYIIVNSNNINVKIAASISLKNLVKKFWENDDETDYVLNVNVKEGIKDQILHVMIDSESHVQKQLSETISIIGRYDFPNKWQGLLPQIVGKIVEGNFTVINGILQTCHSLFKRYRTEMRSDELFLEIKGVINFLGEPLTKLVEQTFILIEQHNNDKNALIVLWNSVLLICKVFHSINHQDLPEFFEDNMNIWMTHFVKVFNYENTLLIDNSNKEAPGILEEVKTEVCEILSLYQHKYDEEFTPYLETFVKDILNTVLKSTSDPKYDNLISVSLEFLAHVAQKASHRESLSKLLSIQQMCEAVIIPSIELRQSDQDMFIEDPDEYIRLDIEGSNAQSRRKSACELVKALCRFFEDEVVTNFSQYIQKLLITYTENPQQYWKLKDSALFLITTVSSKGGTEKLGVTSTTKFVNIEAFYKQHVLPELQGPLNSNAIVKAGCIKYLMAFRSILSSDDIRSSIPLLFNVLLHPSNVVHSYAAAAINKLLMLQSADLTPIMNADNMGDTTFVCGNLCLALKHEGSEENEYVMMALMRTLAVLKTKTLIVVERLVIFLKEKLEKAVKETKKPIFNHYLIESFALCIKVVCGVNHEYVEQFETMLFPIFEIVLMNNIEDFLPYAFQIFSLMLDHHPAQSITDNYVQLFPFLINLELWENDGNVPALVRLLLSYLEKANGDIIANKVDNMFKIFQKLNRSRALDTFGYTLISAIMVNLPKQMVQAYLKPAFCCIFQRLSKPVMKTTKYLKGFVCFLSTLFVVFSPSEIISCIELIQSGIFKMVLDSVLLPYFPQTAEMLESKTCIIGIIRLLTESEELINGNYVNYWKGLMNGVISNIGVYMKSTQATTEIEGRFSDTDDTKDKSTALNQLIFVKRKVVDPAKEVTDIKLYLGQKLQQLNQMNSQRFGLLINGLEKEDGSNLQTILNSVGISF